MKWAKTLLPLNGCELRIIQTIKRALPKGKPHAGPIAILSISSSFFPSTRDRFGMWLNESKRGIAAKPQSKEDAMNTAPIRTQYCSIIPWRYVRYAAFKDCGCSIITLVPRVESQP